MERKAQFRSPRVQTLPRPVVMVRYNVLVHRRVVFLYTLILKQRDTLLDEADTVEIMNRSQECIQLSFVNNMS